MFFHFEVTKIFIKQMNKCRYFLDEKKINKQEKLKIYEIISLVN